MNCSLWDEKTVSKDECGAAIHTERRQPTASVWHERSNGAELIVRLALFRKRSNVVHQVPQLIRSNPNALQWHVSLAVLERTKELAVRFVLQ